jgi:hypothetical protein
MSVAAPALLSDRGYPPAWAEGLTPLVFFCLRRKHTYIGASCQEAASGAAFFCARGLRDGRPHEGE